MSCLSLAKLAQASVFDAPAVTVNLTTSDTDPLGYVGSKRRVCEVDLSIVPEFQSGQSKMWRRRVSGGSSWQTAACACLRTWFGNTCKRGEEVTFDGWTSLCAVEKTWYLSLCSWWRAPRVWGMGWGRCTLPALEQSGRTTSSVNISWIFKTNKLSAHTWSNLLIHCVFVHLVNTLLASLLVYKGEGLPADFRALAWWTLSSFKDSPLWWEPPVKQSLELCPLNGAQKDHGFCRTGVNRLVVISLNSLFNCKMKILVFVSFLPIPLVCGTNYFIVICTELCLSWPWCRTQIQEWYQQISLFPKTCTHDQQQQKLLYL